MVKAVPFVEARLAREPDASVGQIRRVIVLRCRVLNRVAPTAFAVRLIEVSP